MKYPEPTSSSEQFENTCLIFLLHKAWGRPHDLHVNSIKPCILFCCSFIGRSFLNTHPPEVEVPLENLFSVKLDLTWELLRIRKKVVFLQLFCKQVLFQIYVICERLTLRLWSFLRNSINVCFYLNYKKCYRIMCFISQLH